MANSPSYEPDDEYGPTCSICGCELELDDESCWQCHGEGGWHDCGEDCCCCLDKEEITEECDECGGTGKQWYCPNARNHPSSVTSLEPRP